jgi:two-component system cell cycle response regulator CtrA
MKFLSFQSARNFTDALVPFLKSRLAAVDEVSEIDEALDMVKFYDYDAVLVRVADERAHHEAALIRRLRMAGLRVPVIAISCHLDEPERMKVFEAGADDLIVNALSQEEVFLRVQNHVRRNRGFQSNALAVGAVEINMNAKRIFVGGKELHLTKKEYQIIEILVLRKGFVLSKETLLDHLYGGLDEPNPKIVDVFICKIRRKLIAMGAGDLIETNWGRGYMISDKPAAASSPIAEQAQPSPVSEKNTMVTEPLRLSA